MLSQSSAEFVFVVFDDVTFISSRLGLPLMILGPPLDQSRFYAGDFICFDFIIEMNVIDFDARVSISSIDGVFPPEAFAAAHITRDIASIRAWILRVQKTTTALQISAATSKCFRSFFL